MAKKTVNNASAVDEKEFLSLMADPIMYSEPIITQNKITISPNIGASEQTVSEAGDTENAIETDIPQGKRRQRGNVDEYIQQFLSPGQPTVIRRGVYIDRELHTKISALVGVVGKRNLTVGSFVDTVLNLHFEQFKDEVKTVFSKRFNKIL